jgi:hypothetical protein
MIPGLNFPPSTNIYAFVSALDKRVSNPANLNQPTIYY